ncbi:hypothetical protein ISS07_03640 [Candidatus Woesearchaeota archaeon]|nr:hypothetical protein [Candidatus Woesearchaeota archaeon]
MMPLIQATISSEIDSLQVFFIMLGILMVWLFFPMGISKTWLKKVPIALE